MKIIKIYSHKQPNRCFKTLHKITQKATAMENNSNKTMGRKFRHLKENRRHFSSNPTKNIKAVL